MLFYGSGAPHHWTTQWRSYQGFCYLVWEDSQHGHLEPYPPWWTSHFHACFKDSLCPDLCIWALLFPHWIHFYLLNLLRVVNIFEPERPKTWVVSSMSPKIFHLVFYSLKISLASTDFFLSPQLVPWTRIHTCKVRSHQQQPPITIPHNQPTAFVFSPNPKYTSQKCPATTRLSHSPFTECASRASAFCSHLPFPAASVSCPNHQLTTFYLYMNFVLIFIF